MTQRIEYIDAMRGYTMILVVMHHVSLMAFGRDSIINEWLAEFRMPLFFWVSGFVLYKSTRVWNFKESIAFLKRKILVQVFSPLFFFCIYVFTSHRDFVASLIDPSKAGYWFTFMLFVFYVIYIIMQTFLDKLKIDVYKRDCLLLFGGVCMFVSGYVISYLYLEKQMIVMGIIGGAYYKYFLFFIIGVLAKKYFKHFEKALDSSYFLPCCISIYFLLNIFSSLNPVAGVFFRISFILLTAITGIVMTFSFFRKYQYWLTKEKIFGNVLQTIGHRTLDIYLLHYFFIPYSLSSVFPLFLKYELPIIEFACSLVVASMVIMFCILLSAVLRTSPKLGRVLFGAQG